MSSGNMPSPPPDPLARFHPTKLTTGFCNKHANGEGGYNQPFHNGKCVVCNPEVLDYVDVGERFPLHAFTGAEVSRMLRLRKKVLARAHLTKLISQRRPRLPLPVRGLPSGQSGPGREDCG